MSSCCSTRRRSRVCRTAMPRSQTSSGCSNKNWPPDSRTRRSAGATGSSPTVSRSPCRAPSSHGCATCRVFATFSPRQLRATTVRDSAADRRARPLGPGARHCGTGREDRDHRLWDRRRPSLFDPTGYAMPVGFPKGQERFTTAKVIVARVFAPKNATRRVLASRSRTTTRATARTSQVSPQVMRTRRQEAAGGSRASRRAHTSGTTRCSSRLTPG